jgi:ankyrin repeat protein
VLKGEDESKFRELEQLIDGFPNGVDGFVGRRWIINAIDCGSKTAVLWMLSRKVDLSFRDEEGYTVLHAAIERSSADRYEVLDLLLRNGAPVNAHGINDWTPAHMAAVREDIDALEVLMRFGADLSIRTRIDDYATPLEEARHLGKTRAVEFLERVA